MSEIVLDTRPRCASTGWYLGVPVPCELHLGHDVEGTLHHWTSPMDGAHSTEWATGDVNDDMPLGEVKSWFEGRLHGGMSTECPVCHQNAKVYRRTINASMARSLVRMYRIAGLDTINITKAIPADSREEGKLRYWGLVESAGKRGLWRVTEKGRDWLLLRVTVPRYCYVYDDVPIEMGGDEISFRDVVEMSDADYRELVGV
jgi:hypothetical protein